MDVVGRRDSVYALLEELRSAGVELWVAEGQLRYRAPPGSLTPTFLERIKAAKPDLIELLARLSAPKRPALVARSGETSAPLSFSQERLWFLDQLEALGGAYNLAGALELEGGLHLEALEQSLSELVRRHAILRTRITEADGRGRQETAPPFPVMLSTVDLAAATGDLHAEVQAQISAVAAAPFDLSRTPLFRARLLRRSPEHHILVLVLHHSICDRWSFGVITREIAALYEAYSQGRVSPLPELNVQYGDYAEWQRECLQGEALDRLLGYWRERFASVPATLDLPTDRHRPAIPTFRGAHLSYHLPHDLAERLSTLAKRESATLFMVLLAGFKATLARWSGQSDLVVGAPVAGRTEPNTEGLIGCFVNTLALRTDCGGDPSFAELVGRVRETTLGALAHQDLPFEKLVSDLGLTRDRSRQLLFQTAFALQNTPRLTFGSTGLNLTPLPVEAGGATVDLELILEEREDGLTGVLEYATDLFDQGTIEGLGARLKRLLEQAVARPDVRLSELDLLAPEERLAQTRDWNAPSAAPSGQSLHVCFASHAQRAPDAPAVVGAGAALSYGELDRRSNQLARHLLALGVGREVVVGLCFNRSPDLLVALLAVLKAGGAFLPLDPGLPPERLDHVLNQAAAPVILGEEAALDRLPSFWGHVIDLAADWPQISSRSEAPLAVELLPDLSAYVIFTSGSSGLPKGVTLTHRGLANLIAAQELALAPSAQDQVLQFARHGFDAFVWECALALAFGGTLHLAPPADLVPGPELAALLAARGISFVTLPPSALTLLQAVYVPALRTVVAAGEALTPGVARPWAERLDLVNAYGPTEATIWSTFHKVEPEATSTPIGRPILNAPAYVLGPNLDLLPAGAIGELYVAGEGLARGYVGRPDLTAERFLPNPFGPPGTRMYRTGDLVRWTSDGRLDFLGRADQQVKLRGFRIELGEIEARLQACPGVDMALVVIREDTPGERRLVAYFTGSAEPGAIRDQLRRHLPDYMIPSAFAPLASFPVNASGKIDRGRLPAPELRSGQALVEPRTPMEAVLTSIWAEVLHGGPVGVDDNFFELGGDSIQCIQVAARARRAGLHVTVAQIFEHQTVAALASVALAAPPIDAEQGPVIGEAALSPIQRWLLDADPQDLHHCNQSLFIAPERPLGAELLQAALGAIWEHHDVLRSRFEKTSAGWRQWTAGADEAPILERVDCSKVSDADLGEAVALASRRAQACLDLATGPLMKAMLFDLGPARGQRLLWIIHHLVVDGVSWRILAEDFVLAYMALEAGAAPSLSPKSSAFRAWSKRLAAYAGSGALQEELPYWLEQSRLAAEASGRIEEAGLVRDAAQVEVQLSVDETEALLQEIPSAYRTQINDALLAGLALGWRTWAGATRLGLALEGHGREDLFEDIDLSRTVGWFTSLFPVVLDIEGANDPGEVLRSVKESLRAVPRRGIGYGPLRHLSPDSEAFAQRQPSICFNYLGRVDTPGNGAGQGLLRLLPDNPGGEVSLLRARPFAIEINALVQAGRMRIRLSYPSNAYRAQQMSALLEACAEGLRQIVDHCRDNQGGFTLSDFDLINA